MWLDTDNFVTKLTWINYWALLLIYSITICFQIEGLDVNMNLKSESSWASMMKRWIIDVLWILWSEGGKHMKECHHCIPQETELKMSSSSLRQVTISSSVKIILISWRNLSHQTNDAWMNCYEESMAHHDNTFSCNDMSTTILPIIFTYLVSWIR